MPRSASRCRFSEDHPIVDAGPALVRFRVHELEVEQHQVAAADPAQKLVGRGEPGRSQRHVQAFQPLQHRLQKHRLHERFAAGKGHAAIDEQRRLAVEESGQLVGALAPADDPVAVRPMQNLGLEGPTLGVVAPSAAKRAALEEHGGAQPGTIVNGQFADVENQPRHGRRHSLPPSPSPTALGPGAETGGPGAVLLRAGRGSSRPSACVNIIVIVSQKAQRPRSHLKQIYQTKSCLAITPRASLKGRCMWALGAEPGGAVEEGPVAGAGAAAHSDLVAREHTDLKGPSDPSKLDRASTRRNRLRVREPTACSPRRVIAPCGGSSRKASTADGERRSTTTSRSTTERRDLQF